MDRKLESVIKNQRGFSLMEIMIVLAIIGLIGSFVASNIFKRFDEAKVDSTKIQMKQLATVLGDFRRRCSFYPTTDQGLDALVRPPSGRECKNYDPDGFVKKVPKDSWNNDFVYTSDGEKFIIKSLGSDGKEGGDGFAKDISSEDLD